MFYEKQTFYFKLFFKNHRTGDEKNPVLNIFKNITRMTQAKDTCNRVGIHKDKRVQQVVAAVLQQSLGQECPAKLKVREPLV